MCYTRYGEGVAKHISGGNCPWGAARLPRLGANKLTTTGTNHWFFRPQYPGVPAVWRALKIHWWSPPFLSQNRGQPLSNVSVCIASFIDQTKFCWHYTPPGHAAVQVSLNVSLMHGGDFLSSRSTGDDIITRTWPASLLLVARKLWKACPY
jgi:hypothetical protein